MRSTFAIFAAQLAIGGLLGRLLIPVLRKLKTGKLEIYIGDRYKQDGSEPRGGGALMLLSFIPACLFGAAALTPASGQVGGILGTILFAGLLTAMGLAEDLDRDARGGIGIKSGYRLAVKLMASGCFTAVMSLLGYDGRMALLPFRWGYIDLGQAYIPLNAVLMTVIITAAEVCDCQRGIHDTGVDGLCAMTMFVGFLGLYATFGGLGREPAGLVSLCAAGSCGGYLIWGMRPSKLFTGQSGGLFLGSVMCGIMVLSGLQGAVLLAMALPLMELAASLLQRAVFKRKKKLLLKGASLHEHLRGLGWEDSRIMAVFALLQTLFCVGAAAYGIYETKLTIP